MFKKGSEVNHTSCFILFFLLANNRAEQSTHAGFSFSIWQARLITAAQYNARGHTATAATSYYAPTLENVHLGEELKENEQKPAAVLQCAHATGNYRLQMKERND